MESNSTAFLIKIKLRHSLGRPSRSDFVQSEFLMPKKLMFLPDNLYYETMKPTIEAHEKGLPTVRKKQKGRTPKSKKSKKKKAKRSKEVNNAENS